VDKSLRDAYDDAVAWLLGVTPDSLDPYIAWIAAAFLAVILFAFIIAPIVSLLLKLSAWLQQRDRYRIWKWYSDGLQSGEMTADQAREHFTKEVAKQPDEHRLNIYYDLWVSLEALSKNNPSEPRLLPAPKDDEDALKARIAFVEAARSVDKKEQEAFGAVLQGRLDVAARLLKEAAQLSPDESARRFRRFGTLVQKGHPKLALEMFEQAALTDPGHAGSRKALGESYRTASKGSPNRIELLRKAAVEFKAAADLALNANPALAAEALTDCGRCLRLIGEDNHTALIYLNEGLRLKEKLKKGSRPSINHHEIGLILAQRGDLRAALDHQLIAAGLDRRLGRGAELLTSRSAVGVLHRKLGELVTAREIHQDVLKLYPPGDTRRAGELNNLGIVYRLEGKFEEARHCHYEALQIAESLKRLDGQGVALNCLADLALAEKDPDAAETLLNKARRPGERPSVAHAINDKLGVVARLRGQFREAEAIHRTTLRASAQPQPIVQLNLAWALALQNNAEAKLVAELARRSFEQSGQKLEIAESYAVEAQLLASQNDHAGAARQLKVAAEIYRHAGARKLAVETYRAYESNLEKLAAARSGRRASKARPRPAKRKQPPHKRTA